MDRVLALVRSVRRQPLTAVLERAVAEPGPESLDLLTGLRVEELSPFDRVLYLQALAAHRSWVEAQLATAVVGVAAAEPRDAHDSGTEEVRLALRLSGTGARMQVEQARELTTRLPATHAALAAGRISLRHAQAVLDATLACGPQVAAQVEARVLPRAADQTVAELRRALRRAVLVLQPAQAAAEHAAVRAERKVSIFHDPGAASSIVVETDPVEAQEIWLALDTRARALRDRARRTAKQSADRTVEQGSEQATEQSMDAWRVDALVDLARTYLQDPGTPTAHGRPVTVGVVVDLPTLVGLAERPGEVRGYGPVPAPVARDLASRTSAWRLLATEAGSGRLLATTRYRPTQAILDYLSAAWSRCSAPGCNQPEHVCEHDHRQPYAAGGSTDVTNLDPRCLHHHPLKTAGLLTVTPCPDGGTMWTTPSGHTYHAPPPRVLPDDGLDPPALAPQSAAPPADLPPPDAPSPGLRHPPPRYEQDIPPF